MIATGGGAVVDPRNRWALYRGRIVGLARRPAGGPRPAPAPVARTSGRWSPGATRSGRSATSPRDASGSTPRPTIRQIGRGRGPRRRRRRRQRVASSRRAVDGGADRPTTLLRATTPIGRIVHRRRDRRRRGGRRQLDALRAPPGDPRLASRAPGRRSASALAAALRERGWTVEHILLPQGEAAKRLAVIETAAARAGARCGSSAASRSSRSAAGRSATRPGSWPRSSCAASRSSRCRRRSSPRSIRSIGGKTGGRPARGQEPRRRVPSAGRDRHRRRAPADAPRAPACGRRSARRSRWRRSATSGCSSCSSATARRSPAATIRRSSRSGVVAELVERAAWAKVEVVIADEREQGAAGGRITLNLGPLARPRRRGGGRLRRRCSTARRSRTGCGRRAGSASRSGSRRPSAPSGSSALLDALGLATRAAPLPARRACSDHLATDKKHAAGRLRWVLPTADGSSSARTSRPRSSSAARRGCWPRAAGAPR